MHKYYYVGVHYVSKLSEDDVILKYFKLSIYEFNIEIIINQISHSNVHLMVNNQRERRQ